MIQKIMKDPLFLAMKSEQATKGDEQIAKDLVDTLNAHKNECVGMAANMIGKRKSIIAIVDEDHILVMYNPVIKMKLNPYETEEGCLSLLGERKTTRYEKIVVEWYNQLWMKMITEFTGFTAQIIQHEIDHCNGVLI